MSSSSPDPQVVFRSALPKGTSLVVIFVPSKDRDGGAIDQDYWVDGVVIDGKYYDITNYEG